MATTTSTRKTAAPRKRTATPKAAPTAVETPTGVVTENGETRVALILEKGDDTKTYSVFTFPEGNGCVGKLYVPKGVETVKLLLIGPAE